MASTKPPRLKRAWRRSRRNSANRAPRSIARPDGMAKQQGLWSRPWTLLARSHPSAFLLAAQLLSLLVYPAMDESSSGRLLFGAVALVVVPLAVWVVNRSPAVRWVAWLLAIPAMLLTACAVLFAMPILLPWS